MIANADSSLVAGIDFLSGGVTTVVARESADGIEFLGSGFAKITGHQGSTALDVPATVSAIRESVAMATKCAEGPIARVFVGLPGSMVTALTSYAAIGVKDQGAVSEEDVRRVSLRVSDIVVPPGNEILQIIFQQFELDDLDGIENPIGLAATRLGLRALVLANAESPRQIFSRCVEEAGLPSPTFTLSSLATAEAILTGEERKRGVVLLDFQEEGVDLVIFQRGMILLAKHLRLPGGAKRVQLEELLSASPAEDDLPKEESRRGNGRRKGFNGGEVIPKIFRMGQPPIIRESLEQMVEACTDYLLLRIEDELGNPDFRDRFSAPIVLTGEVANMPGLDRMLEKSFSVSVRRPEGSIREFAKETETRPAYIKARGLVLWGLRNHGSLS